MMIAVRRIVFFLPLLALTLAFASGGCDGKKEEVRPNPAPDLLARVGEETITAESFRAEAVRRKVSGDNEPGKRALLDEMVRDLRLLQQARRKGYDRDPEMVRRYRTMLISRAREDFLPENDADAKTVSDEDVNAYYEAHKPDYAVPTRVRVAMIFVATPAGLNAETLAAKRSKIEGARAAVTAANLPPAANFGGLAATYSENQETRYTGGDLGYQIKGMTNFSPDPRVVDAVFALNTAGQLSEVVTGKDGLYLFKLMEISPAGALPLAKVQGRIRSELFAAQRKKAEGAMAAVLEAIPAETHPEKLAGLNLPSAPETGLPPAVPGR